MSRILDINEERKILCEARGILNHHYIKMSENQEVVNKIYNYTREQIIRNLNLGLSSCSFNVPLNLYNDSPLTHIQQLVINYSPQKTKVKMQVSKNTNNGYTINIFVSLFVPSFKASFFHEFTHLYQLKKSFRNGVQPSTDEVIKYFNLNYSKTEKVIMQKLQDIVYMYNPIEVDAKKTEIYANSYDVASLVYDGLNKDELYTGAKNIFWKNYYLNEDIEEFITKNKDILLPYIWTLLIQSNIPQLTKTYDLFSSFLFQNMLALQLVTDVQEIRRNNGTNEMEEIAKAYPKFLTYQKLVDKSIRCVIRGLQRHKEYFISKLYQAMDTAFDDVMKQNKESIVYEHIKIKENIKFGEVIYTEKNKEYIQELYSTTVSDIFYKKYILDTYLKMNNIQIEIKFGFDSLQEMYEEYLSNNEDIWRNTNINYYMLPTATSYLDIPDIIEAINFEAYS